MYSEHNKKVKLHCQRNKTPFPVVVIVGLDCGWCAQNEMVGKKINIDERLRSGVLSSGQVRAAREKKWRRVKVGKNLLKMGKKLTNKKKAS